jgi:8-oxo-dGTP diphosphatase
VHRPRHEDWSLPKGKLNRGESWEEAALREVEEESAVKAVIVERLVPTSYWVGDNPKIVLWFRMSIEERNEFVPNDEVDAIKWVWAERLAEELTLEADVRVAAEALSQIGQPGPTLASLTQLPWKPKGTRWGRGTRAT